MWNITGATPQIEPTGFSLPRARNTRVTRADVYNSPSRPRTTSHSFLLFFPSFLLPSPPLPPSCITVTPKIRPFSTDKRRIKDRISGVEEEEESRGVTRRVNNDLVVGIFVLRVVWRLDKK